MYVIEFTKRAEKQFDKLPYEIRERIVSSLDRTRIRPQHFFERLVGEKSYKLRVGDYRVIADILSDKILILVLEVGHRKNIYGK